MFKLACITLAHKFSSDTDEMDIFNHNRHLHNTRNNNKLQLHDYKYALYKNSFLHKSPILWTSVPHNIMTSASSLHRITLWFKKKFLFSY